MQKWREDDNSEAKLCGPERQEHEVFDQAAFL